MRKLPIQSSSRIYSSGIALVAVLAILTVLSIMAAAFAFYMSTEHQLGMISSAKVQSDMLAQSALEHAFSLLERDLADQPGWDDLSESWNTHFLPGNTNDAVDIDGLPSVIKDAGSKDGRWIYVRNDKGNVIGRYAVKIEDESGKINLNTATATSTKMQNQGVGTFEMLLTDGQGRGLPISREFARNLVEYRYGRDKEPGQANVDDNLTESTYIADKIDNDADNVYDELDEGTDEQAEYNPLKPRWDDRSYSFFYEIFDHSDSGKGLSLNAQRLLNRYGTIFTTHRDLFYDDRDETLRKQLNLNVSTKRQLRKILRRANDESRFESSSRSMHTLISNLMDYRDENHVLTTVESAYGVEAVCFNEIMAHDGSFLRETDWSGWWPYVPNKRDRILTYNRFYGLYYGLDAKERRWKFAGMSSAGTDGGYRLVRIKLNKPDQLTGGGNEWKYFSDFLQCDTKWPKDFWKNGTAVIYNGENKKEFDIDSNPQTSKREFILKCKASDYDFIAQASSNSNGRVVLRNGWLHGPWMNCGIPESTETFFVPVPHKKLERSYYKVLSLMHAASSGRTTTRELDMDGDPANYTIQNELKDDKGHYKLQYPYKQGHAVRPNSHGYINVTITSSRKSRNGQRYESVSDRVVFLRPDIVELINISDHPISLKNWRVVVNTGLAAERLATVDNSVYYSPRMNGRFINTYPSIAPGGHFYMTNNREIFDLEHCNGSGTYGDGRNEINQVFELPDAKWGIEYDVIYTDHDYIKVTGADWKEDQLKGEMVEYIVDRKSTRRDWPNGIYNFVYGNDKDTLYVFGQAPYGSGLLPGDKIRVRGLPRQGGFVSFTLKNEYNQLTARTTEYGSVDEEEYGYSTEKYDPTHYTWVKIENPTMGGLPREANSRLMRGSDYIRAHVKNNRFASIAEIQKVRKAGDWENIGERKGGKSNIQILKALSKYFTISGVRLDPEEEDVHIEGWKPAFGKARTGRDQTLVTRDADWEPGIWVDQTLRILNGPLKGEKFFIKNSNENSVTVDGYSIPGNKQFRADNNVKFSVGPGYSTPLYYTRKDNEEGIWEWKDKGLKHGTYGLYIFGLSDSIDTTEFLEENFNAEMDIAVWNYKTGEFDSLPLPEERISGSKSDDAYSMVSKPGRHKYDKTDGIYCGQIFPRHISANGGVKLRITPHNLQSEDNSGFAWFDYAYLSPAGAEGKININTASERVLTSLKGINKPLAFNIWNGIDRNGRTGLKPFKNISDVLDVKGFDTKKFGDICNLITTRSDQYRIQVVAQALSDPDNNGNYKILAKSRADMVVDRSKLSDGEADTANFTVISRK
jgi:DNA uptake protein ComE-like DNA-binding protein